MKNLGEAETKDEDIKKNKFDYVPKKRAKLNILISQCIYNYFSNFFE